MRVLITRPREDAEETARLLEERGVKVATESLLAIVPVAAPDVSMDNVQAILFTSANGVRSLSAIQQDRDVPVYTVGDASARAARIAGYEDVHSAGGDVETLAQLVVESLHPEDGKLLHPAANVIAGDLKSLLEAQNFQVDKVKMYESRTAVALTDALIDALKMASIQAAFFFSPRTAKTFVSLSRKAGVETYLSSVTAYALSQAVADQLAELSWHAVRIAEKPEQDSLLAMFDEDRKAGTLIETNTARSKDHSGQDDQFETDKDVKKVGGKPMSSDDMTNGKAPDEKPKAAPENSQDIIQSGEASGGSYADNDLDIDSSPEGDAETVSSSTKRKPSGSGGFILFLLVIILGLGGFASFPYWRDEIPQPYQSYLPEFPQSQTATKLSELSAAVASNKAEVARLQNELQSVGTELENVQATAGAAPDNGVNETVASLKEKVDGIAIKLTELGQPVSSGKKSAVQPLNQAVTHRIDLLAGTIEKQSQNMTSFMDKVIKDGDALQEEFAKVNSRLENVELTRADASSVLKLSDRINDVEKLAKAMVSRHDASLANLLAVVQLRAKAADGQPFDAELRTARALAADKVAFDTLVGELSGLAGRGVATTTSLRTAFDVLSATAAKAAAAPEGDSLLDKTLGRVTGLVTVRRIDGKDDGPSVNAMLARAEKALDAGDIATATTELNAITAPAVAAVLKPWIERAEDRVALDAALSTLTSNALARVAGSAIQAQVSQDNQKLSKGSQGKGE